MCIRDSHDTSFVINSHAIGSHAIGIIEGIVLAVVEECPVGMEILIEPLISDIIRIIEVHGKSVGRAGNVDRFVGLPVINRRLAILR